MNNVRILLVAGMLASATLAWGAPMLGLVKAGTELTTETLGYVPATYSLDLIYNSDGNTISLLTYWVSLTGTPGTVTYGATPVTGLGSATQAWQDADLLLGPSSGAPLTTWTYWGKAVGEYAATSTQHVVRLQFNTSLLGEGSYWFTPIGEEAANDSIQYGPPFASPGAFNLIIVPEPGAGVLLALGSLALLRRRRQGR
ncbi:MAG: PEP-CTERM sorting domain-containing protein [Verrucomicrobiae bacterium]|nr:PEP-CTERM sorting domain-containing protein [Verrucomicrobiae bacterium]